jgi:small subunit ribosomal protein S17
MSEAAENRARTVTGRVVSDKADKTVTVLIERRVKHPVYGKYLTRSSKIHVHDENNECKVGDLVTVYETRPVSKTKTWALLKIEERAAAV